MFNRVRVISSLLAAAAAFAALAFTVVPEAEAQSVTWKQLFPGKFPSARTFTAMAYDPVSKKTVLFGGFDGSRYLSETWTFNGTTWSRQKTPIAPSPRALPSMAF